MKVINRVLSILDSIVYGELTRRVKGIELDPPDIVIYTGKTVILNRLLVCRGVDYDVLEMSEYEARGLLDSYKALLKALPEGVTIYLFKEELDVSSLLKRIGNEIINIQVDIERLEETPKRIKLNTRLEKLKRLYDLLLSGKPFFKVTLVVVFRVEAVNKDTAKSIANYYESLLTSTFERTYGLRLERALRSDIVQFILNTLGITSRNSLERIVVEVERLSHLQPVKLDKPPSLEKTIVLGIELDSNHPVEISPLDLYKHMAVIGPTGRGKSTLLASMIEQVVSEDLQRVIAFDFKGDLRKMITPGLLETITPDTHPVSILVKPRLLDAIDWKLIVTEALSYSSDIPGEVIVRALSTMEGNSADTSFKPEYQYILSPFESLLNRESRVDDLVSVLRGENVIVSVEGHSIVYQNAYVSLCLGLIRHILLRDQVEANTIIFIDDAWRILELRVLRELIREGRSRKIGVVLSTQSPRDLPRDLVENIHVVIIFGSKSREYISMIKEMFSLPDNIVSILPKLGVGVGLYVNTTTRDTRIVKTLSKPSTTSQSLK